ncbi:LysE family translocator [Ruegeria sp. EL01]|uniref:LysE family translocator n=1 Tax=Ruegeria sp. EL01 TaxID=2107578 RepID=UPI000EA7F740|nr:LysE family translocator [Ruegeria sp. EL01]
MTGHEVATFAVFAALLVTSPGPNGLLILSTVPKSGLRAGFANIAGFAAAFAMHGTLSILGLSLLLMKSAMIFTTIKYLGALYLCWIGVKSLRAATAKTDTPPQIKASRGGHTMWHNFVAGFLTNALNPKVSLFYLAAFPQFIPAGAASTQSAYLLVALHILIATLWFSMLVLLSAKLSQITVGRSVRRWMQGITGIAFIGFGLKLMSFRSQT